MSLQGLRGGLFVPKPPALGWASPCGAGPGLALSALSAARAPLPSRGIFSFPGKAGQPREFPPRCSAGKEWGSFPFFSRFSPGFGAPRGAGHPREGEMGRDEQSFPSLERSWEKNHDSRCFRGCCVQGKRGINGICESGIRLTQGKSGISGIDPGFSWLWRGFAWMGMRIAALPEPWEGF